MRDREKERKERGHYKEVNDQGSAIMTLAYLSSFHENVIGSSGVYKQMPDGRMCI